MSEMVMFAIVLAIANALAGLLVGAISLKAITTKWYIKKLIDMQKTIVEMSEEEDD